jgi:hypothetical protein
MEATVLLAIYLTSELILIGTNILSARYPLVGVPGSACEAPPPRHHLLAYLADVHGLSLITETRSPRNKNNVEVEASLRGVIVLQISRISVSTWQAAPA